MVENRYEFSPALTERFERVTEGVVAIVPDIGSARVSQKRHVAVAIVSVERRARVRNARQDAADVAVAHQLRVDGVIDIALLNYVEAVEDAVINM